MTHVLLPGLVSRPLCAFLFDYAIAAAGAGKMKIDRERTLSVGFDPMTESLLELLAPHIEREVGEPIVPTYSYLRIYRRGDALGRHTDRDACEISVTLNIGRTGLTQPWPLWVEDANGQSAVSLEPGDALLYAGITLPHWRETFDGERNVQVFLHYVRSDGPYRQWAFDKRDGLAVSPAARRIVRQLAGV